MRTRFLWIAAFVLSSGVVAAQQAPNPVSLVNVSSPPPMQAPSGGGVVVSQGATSGPRPDLFEAEGSHWVNVEYLLWFVKQAQVPPLVSVGPASSGGILDRGATSVFGPGSSLDTPLRSGARVTAGMWLDEDDLWGIEASYFFLASSGKNFNLAGDGSADSQTIGRPFFNPITQAEDAQAVAFPGTLAGLVGVSTASFLQGGDANFLCNLCSGCNYRVDSLTGFRYFEVDERLTVTENLTVLPGVATTGGTQFDIIDNFKTHNRFYGGQVGLRTELSRGRLYAVMTGKVAVGLVNETVDVEGSTRTTTPAGVITTQPGGLLALPTNIGHYDRSQFAILPEGNVMVGYQVSPHVRAWAGYTVLYCSKIARPGDQIDRVINPTLLPTSTGAGTTQGAARPVFSFHDSDFWAQGLACGLEFRF